MHKNMFYGALLAFIVLIGGCDTVKESVHEEEIVVEAYLTVDEPLPPIWLAKSIPVNTTYSTGGTALRNATVKVHLLTASGSVERTYAYNESGDEPGAYYSLQNDVVLGGRTYQLQVDAGPEFEIVTAETTTPAEFELIAPSAEEIEYKDPAQYSMLVTQSPVPNGQSVFVFTMETLDPTIYNLVPIYFKFILDKEIEEIEKETKSGRTITFNWFCDDSWRYETYSKNMLSLM